MQKCISTEDHLKNWPTWVSEFNHISGQKRIFQHFFDFSWILKYFSQSGGFLRKIRKIFPKSVKMLIYSFCIQLHIFSKKIRKSERDIWCEFWPFLEKKQKKRKCMIFKCLSIRGKHFFILFSPKNVCTHIWAETIIHPIYAYTQELKKSKKIWKPKILTQNSRKNTYLFKGKKTWKSLKSIFSVSIGFEAYSLKFPFFALEYIFLNFFLLTLRRN